MVLGIPWLDDEEVAFHFGKARVFPLMDGTKVDTTEERQH
jgi:hypothetical protein